MLQVAQFVYVLVGAHLALAPLTGIWSLGGIHEPRFKLFCNRPDIMGWRSMRSSKSKKWSAANAQSYCLNILSFGWMPWRP